MGAVPGPCTSRAWHGVLRPPEVQSPLLTLEIRPALEPLPVKNDPFCPVRKLIRLWHDGRDVVFRSRLATSSRFRQLSLVPLCNKAALILRTELRSLASVCSRRGWPGKGCLAPRSPGSRHFPEEPSDGKTNCLPALEAGEVPDLWSCCRRGHVV